MQFVKKQNEMQDMMKLVNQMSKAEQAALVEQIMKMMREGEGKKGGTCHELVENDVVPDCPRCGAKASLFDVIKDGRKKNGSQRYLCKKCGRHFLATTGTAFAWIKKDAETWRKFINMTVSGATLRECQQECGIAYQTAFNWRHKLLHVFEEELKNANMSGQVEVDEMQIPLSYKGNHVQGDFGARKKAPGVMNDMPRKAFKRGSDNKSMSSKDKACVFCMIQDGNKKFYAAVPGVGFMNVPMLNATVAKHTDKENVHMLADNYKITRKYFEDNGYKHTILLSNTSDNPHDHKPEVKDGLHLQHVNAMHHHLREFLKPYCGVSSKYLGHYVALFVWLKNIGATRRKKNAEKVSVARAATPGCYIPAAQNYGRPAVPQCA